MASLRDYLGSKCPCCASDILQQAPSSNRMPGAELAWCPSCKATLSVEELAAPRKRAGFLAKLFGRPQGA